MTSQQRRGDAEPLADTAQDDVGNYAFGAYVFSPLFRHNIQRICPQSRLSITWVDEREPPAPSHGLMKESLLLDSLEDFVHSSRSTHTPPLSHPS